MLRVFAWTLFYIITLGSCDIDVKYKDGLKIKLNRLGIWKTRK